MNASHFPVVDPRNYYTPSIETENITEDGRLTNLLPQEVLGPTINTLFLILRVIQGGFAVTGNLLTILIVLRYEELSDRATPLLIGSLALADMLAG